MSKTASEMMAEVRAKKPLVHHITNYVTVNDCANVCICAGGSPVMTDAAEDIPEMVALASAVVLNIGTLNPRTVESMILAGKEANKHDIPVVLDPVGVGATTYRTSVAERILSEVKISVIKGNAGEIGVLAGLGGTVRGVDSVSGSDDMGTAVTALARRTGAIVAATGAVDHISDGKKVAILRNGSAMMETVSGTGCMLSSVVGCYVGTYGATLESVSAAVTVFNVASEKAAWMPASGGPGSFKVCLLDALHGLKGEDIDKCQKVETAEV